MKIFERIDELCANRGWSYYELSKESGISSNAIYKWKNKGNLPSLLNLQLICDAFGITLKQFFCGADNRLSEDEKTTILELISILRNNRVKK